VRVVSQARPRAVRNALILAAGNGDRFQNAHRQSKLLQPVFGQPLILRTLQTAHDAGIASFEIVLGYHAEALREVIEQHAPAGTRVQFSFNPEWHLENGISVLSARHRLADSRFALLMGDHLFEAPVLTRLLETEVKTDESALAVDSRPAPPDIEAEATKVQIVDSRIVAIGKNLTTYNALDTGLFVCSPSLFAALDASVAAGDTTLSGGIRRLAARGLMRTVDIGDASWYDIDTMADLQIAETQLADPSFQRSRPPMGGRARVARRNTTRSIPESTRLAAASAPRLSSEVDHA
jgi:1L-myo-inositol 1-phosphate cytidylyltransferase